MDLKLIILLMICIPLVLTQPPGPWPIETSPQQVHLSYGGSPDQMMVTWVTVNYTESQIEYGINNLNTEANGDYPTKFMDGGNEHRTMYMHRVLLNNLEYGTKYTYHVGSESGGWSDLFTFTTMKQGNDFSPVFAVYGDLGNKNAMSLPALQDMAQKGKIDAVLHIGDFAYDMADDNARFGDAFMRQIEPIAAYVPYMVCPGNHEAHYNFSNYKARFSMPGGVGENMVWSFNIGRAHIINFNTEVFYDVEFGSKDQIISQYYWLEHDLQEANKKRDEYPWIIVMGHRPMYCSTNDGIGQHCNNADGNPIRISQAGLPGLEDLFYKYGVDLHFYAHEHNYERLWPVYNKKVCNGTKSAYMDPTGPVHIVTGAGGNQEGQTNFDPVPFPWSAFRSDDFGYTRMQVINGTHLSLDQVSVNDHWQGSVIDSIMYVRNKHGMGQFTCHQN